MLDFYWTADHEESPSTPSEERFLGSLSIGDHRQLASILMNRLSSVSFPSFFEDTRLTSGEVQELHKSFHSAYEGRSEKVLEKLDRILSTAAAKGWGLAIFCD